MLLCPRNGIFLLLYSLPDSQLKVPIKIKTDGGFVVLINQLPICDYSLDVISCSQPINMNLHLIKNVRSPANKFDAVSKAYANRIKNKAAVGKI